MVVLDTNIIIDHLRLQDIDKDSILLTIVRQKPKQTFAISIITIQELFEGLSTKDQLKQEYLLETIKNLKILPYDYQVARTSGEIARDLGRPIEFADAAIAATTIINQGSLLSLNQKDFKGIQNLVFSS